MLDTDTRRRIDTARDILVGKVPDPKSQVEQITIALIYKFMDDMDREAADLGGERRFFAGEFEEFGWARLMKPGIGGVELLNLYADGLGKMPENPGIPALFRDIFKNAYLPYRDPETLRAFLKIIDEFVYDHSERLGDAFEYLLSVLGSQGDAGQFRTPRHIIDFIVSVVDPKKDERVLDPACGTAGFLISSYKHILRANTDDGGVLHLSPDERARLAENFAGYDISPDMVRLSLVNMYLHGFPAPRIEEYDTLTQEDHWNDYADVILANPPFMTPTGGIRPHKRFSIQAKRSEVLFVDYMAEHMTPEGRAGIIVPEGIIFQNGTAYKALRKMLVETCLVAVVSLPAGVFQPYSNVKTSVLIMDKAWAKRCDTVAFLKVEADGYDLGAQRRPIERDDLPAVREELAVYLAAARAGEVTADMVLKHGIVVQRATIAATPSWPLAGDSFRDTPHAISAYPWVEVGSLVTTITPPAKIQATDYLDAGRFPILDQSQQEIAGWTNDENALIRPEKPLVIFGDHTCAVKLATRPFAQGADGIKILDTSASLVPEYLFATLRVRPLESDGYRRHFSFLKRMTIPLPPVEVQREIVGEIEGYQRVIDGARAVVEGWRPQIAVDPSWPVVALGEVCSIKSGGTPSKERAEYWDGTIPWVSAKDMKRDVIDDASTHISDAAAESTSTSVAPTGAILVLVRGMGLANGVPISELARPCAFNQDVKALIPSEVIDSAFLRYTLIQQRPKLMALLQTAAHGTLKINTSDLTDVGVALPSLAVQRAVVAEIEAERSLVDGNRELIARMEGKIEATMARVWGEAAG